MHSWIICSVRNIKKKREIEIQSHSWESKSKSSPEDRWKKPSLLSKENPLFSFPRGLEASGTSLSFPICEVRVTNPILYIARLKWGKVYEAVSPVLVRCEKVVDGLQESLCFSRKQPDRVSSWSNKKLCGSARLARGWQPRQPSSRAWISSHRKGEGSTRWSHTACFCVGQDTLLKHSKYSGTDSRFLEYSSIVCSCEDVFY